MLNIWKVQMLLGNLFLITRKICFSLNFSEVEIRTSPFPPGLQVPNLVHWVAKYFLRYPKHLPPSLEQELKSSWSLPPNWIFSHSFWQEWHQHPSWTKKKKPQIILLSFRQYFCLIIGVIKIPSFPRNGSSGVTCNTLTSVIVYLPHTFHIAKNIIGILQDS